MKKLLPILLLIPLCASAQQWSTITADVIVTGANNFGSTPGTTITTAIGDAGTVGGTGTTVGTNTKFGGGPTGGSTPQSITVGTNQGTCSNLGPVQLTGSTLYGAQSLNSAPVAFDNTTSNKNYSISFSGTPAASKQSWFLTCVTIGFPYVSNGNDTDLQGLWDTNGDYYELQMNFACNAGGQMGLRIEQKNGGTAHGPNCVMITPLNANDPLAGTFWLLELRDSNTAWTAIYVYSATGSYIGQSSTIAQADGSGLAFVQAGNNEGNSSSGTTTYFQDMMIGWSSTANQMVTGSAATVTNGSATVSGLTGVSTSTPQYTAIMLPDTGILGGTGDYYWITACTSTTSCTIAGQHCTSSSCSALTTYNGSTVTGSASWEIMPSPFWQNQSLAAGVLAPGRFTNWTPGVPGGIPTNRAQCVNTQCAAVTSAGTSVTSTQINTAISNAPANTYVLLPSGTLSSATGCIKISSSNVTLRGAGANATYLAPTSSSGCGSGAGGSGSILVGSTGNSAGSPQNGPVAVTGVVIQGSTTITLASVSNLTVGNPIVLDQLDPTADAGGIFVNGTGSSYTPSALASPGIAGPYNTIGGGNGIRGGSGCSASPTGCYHQQQIVDVTQCDGNTTVGHACSSGANITIYPGLHMPNWNVANMFAWWATSPVLNAGVEDLHVSSLNNSGANGIEMENCQGCWVKGVASTYSNLAQVERAYSNLCAVTNSYFFLTQNTATSSYGVESFSDSDCLTENNIFQAVTTPIICNGPCSGDVNGYNFFANEYFTSSAGYSIPAIGGHAGGTDSMLNEGNIGDGTTEDVIHGSANLNTYFRNAFSVQPACWSSGATYAGTTYAACTSGITISQIYAAHRFSNLIGNVLGSSQITTYCNGNPSCLTAYTANNTNVIGLGYANSPVGNDTNTRTTTMLWGNADSATGFSSPRFNASEVPVFPPAATAESSIVGVQYNYRNPVPLSQSLPASFYYSSTPYWWPAGKPWPPIGPDVVSGNLKTTTGTAYSYGPTLATLTSQVGGNTLSTYANGYVNTIPAWDCAVVTMGMSPDGTSAEGSFNEATCYGNGSVIGFTGVVKITGTVTVN